MHIELFLLSYFMGQFDDVINCIIMPRGKSSCLQMFFEIGVLKHFAIFTGKNLCGDSNIVFFLWILRIFYQQLFCRTPLVAASVAKTDQKKQRDILRKYTLQIFLLKYNDAKKEFELTYWDSGNTIDFSFFTIQFLPPTQKITIPK